MSAAVKWHDAGGAKVVLGSSRGGGRRRPASFVRSSIGAMAEACGPASEGRYPSRHLTPPSIRVGVIILTVHQIPYSLCAGPREHTLLLRAAARTRRARVSVELYVRLSVLHDAFRLNRRWQSPLQLSRALPWLTRSGRSQHIRFHLARDGIGQRCPKRTAPQCNNQPASHSHDPHFVVAAVPPWRISH